MFLKNYLKNLLKTVDNWIDVANLLVLTKVQKETSKYMNRGSKKVKICQNPKLFSRYLHLPNEYFINYLKKQSLLLKLFSAIKYKT